MKKLFIVLVILILAAVGVYYYTQAAGTEVNEELPEIMKGEDLSQKMSDEEVKQMMDEIENAGPGEMVEEEMPEMMEEAEVRQGQFNEVDFIHKGSGTAKILPETSEGPILRLENFQVTNGPDLYIYLSANANVKENGLGDHIELERLKGNSGNQNYSLPEDHEKYNSVVIWCKAFGVLFSWAELN